MEQITVVEDTKTNALQAQNNHLPLDGLELYIFMAFMIVSLISFCFFIFKALLNSHKQ
jgi:hypothetical protein